MNIYNVYEWVRMCVQCKCVTVRIICFTNNEIFTLNTITSNISTITSLHADTVNEMTLFLLSAESTGL